MTTKRLAVYFDGTWNRADQSAPDGRPKPTNVSKLFEATLPRSGRDQCIQFVHYIQGVGTRKSERIRGGGFGFGISDNIKEGYRFLVSNYEPGDEIYIFGFSRGAYTARSLAGLIRNVGIIRREKLFLVDEAYGHYKDTSEAWRPNGASATAFRKEHTWRNEKITFLGVFDTVGALGAPFGIVLSWIINKLFHCSFHDTQVSNIVESAYHAVAVDEKRLPFLPTLMTPNTKHNASNFEQKWFPGVHSDVGGGYIESGLSDIALEWMAGKASHRGLDVDLAKVSNQQFAPDVTAKPHNSLGIVYRIAVTFFVKLPGVIGLVPKKYRNALPDIQWNGAYHRAIPEKGNVDAFIGNPPGNANLGAYAGDLHPSVIQKINACWGEYRPPNVHPFSVDVKKL